MAAKDLGSYLERHDKKCGDQETNGNGDNRGGDKEDTTALAGTSAPHGRRQNPEAGNGLGTKRVEKEERKTKKKLERHNHERPQGRRTEVGGGCGAAQDRHGWKNCIAQCALSTRKD